MIFSLKTTDQRREAGNSTTIALASFSDWLSVKSPAATSSPTARQRHHRHAFPTRRSHHNARRCREDGHPAAQRALEAADPEHQRLTRSSRCGWLTRRIEPLRFSR
jgi:hypothetical protein